MVPASVFQHTFILLLFTAFMDKAVQETNSTRPHQPTLVRLSQNLMDGYRKGIRPVRDWRHITVVDIDITVYAILGVDEKNQLLKTYLWLRQGWVNEFLTWDPTKYDNITQFSLPKLDIWIPDIVILELIDTLHSSENPYVYVNSKGRVKNHKLYLIATACSLNIYYFPFDTQKCSLSFTSWLHSIRDINVTFTEKGSKLKKFKSNHMSEGEWDLISVSPEYKLFLHHDSNFAEIEYTLVIRRKPLFYVLSLIIPSVFLMLMDVAGFYLPPECGERISFKITVLLGYSVFLMIVYDALPATGTPLLGIYYVVCMSLLMISLMESIFIVQMIHQRNVYVEVPKWLKSLVLEKLKSGLGVQNKMSEMLHYNPSCRFLETEINYIDTIAVKSNTSCPTESQKPSDVASTMTLLSRILKEIVSIKEHVKNNNEDIIAKEWLQIAYILDIFLFRAFVFLMILFAISLAAIWAIKYKH